MATMGIVTKPATVVTRGSHGDITNKYPKFKNLSRHNGAVTVVIFHSVSLFICLLRYISPVRRRSSKRPWPHWLESPGPVAPRCYMF